MCKLTFALSCSVLELLLTPAPGFLMGQSVCKVSRCAILVGPGSWWASSTVKSLLFATASHLELSADALLPSHDDLCQLSGQRLVSVVTAAISPASWD